MQIEILRNKNILFEFLQKEAALQIYLTGDLDDFFWPDTTWYALKEAGEIKSVALLYAGMTPPTLLCFQKKEVEFALSLLHKIRPLLPRKFYAHLGEGFVEVFGRRNIVEHYGLNYKMALKKKVADPADPNIRRLSQKELPEILKLYAEAYPHNWFDSRMLASGKYFGYYLEGVLIGIAGIHVYSTKYKVAALGNIATHDAYRHRRVGLKLTAALCYDLQKHVDIIGLNVRSDNEYAIRLYEKLGFDVEGTYEECFLMNGQ